MAQYRKFHLVVNGKAACGNRAMHVYGDGFSEFNKVANKCEKCEASKQYAFLNREHAKADIAKTQTTEEWNIGSADDWEPETDKSWLVEDLKIIQAHRAKKALTI